MLHAGGGVRLGLRRAESSCHFKDRLMVRATVRVRVSVRVRVRCSVSVRVGVSGKAVVGSSSVSRQS